MAGTRTPPGGRERVLATVAFVDIVDPEGRLPERGPPSRLLDRFVTLAEAAVGRERGHIVTTTRAGVVATFDGPGRAVRAASALRDTVHPLDVSVRAGVHTAEIQVRGDDIAGIGVDIAARVADAARPGEVWVSRTVTDLVAGTGLRFEGRGEHTWRVSTSPGTFRGHRVNASGAGRVRWRGCDRGIAPHHGLAVEDDGSVGQRHRRP